MLPLQWLSNICSYIYRSCCAKYLLFVESYPQRCLKIQSHEFEVCCCPFTSNASQVGLIIFTVFVCCIPVHLLIGNLDRVIKYFDISCRNCWIRGVKGRWHCLGWEIRQMWFFCLVQTQKPVFFSPITRSHITTYNWYRFQLHACSEWLVSLQVVALGEWST